MKKIFSILLLAAAVVMCALALPTEAQAARSGTCGDNLTWTLDDAGHLTISGTGAMTSYSYQVTRPWGTTVKTVTIEPGVTSIGSYAFYDCTSLTTITIGNSVTSIGSSAFAGCDSLTSVTIPASVTSIGYNAFSRELKSIYITDPSAWCKIDFSDDAPYQFYFDKVHIIDANGREVHEVVLDETVTSIPREAFSGNSSLTTITIPNSVTSIGEYAFYACSNLTSITVDSDNTVYHSKGNCLIETASKTLVVGCQNSVIPFDGSVTTIGGGAFGYCLSLTSITLPDVLTCIEEIAFFCCTGLTSVTIPDGVTSIGSSAFRDCTGLTSVVIPDSVTNISNFAFAGCDSLTSVTIPDSVTSIGGSAFADCDSLTSVTIPASVTSIDNYAFYNCGSLWHVLYKGSQQYWETIDINKSGNRELLLATRHYNCTGNEITDPVNKVCIICRADCPHTWNEGTVTKQATCKEEGVMTYTCTACDETKTEPIAKIASHSWDSGKLTKEATCKAEGAKTYTCSVCKETKTEAIAKLTTHTPGAAATATTDQVCTVCGKVLAEATGETESTTPPTEATTPPTETPTEPETEPATEPSVPETTEPPSADEPTEPENTTAAPTEPVNDTQKDDGFSIWIPIVVVLIAGGAAAGVIIWKKKH